jgi:HK97 family phage portal protein
MSTNERSMPAPRDNPDNGQPPGDNPPPVTANPPGDFEPISVGPTSSDGFGNTNTADLVGPGWAPPVNPQAWSGWPDGWRTPVWSQGMLGPLGSRVDVVFACLDLNASILSTMPPYVLRGGLPQPDRTWLTNPEPEVYVSWDAFAKEVFWCFRGVGEVFIYALARNADGFPARFMMLNPADVQVDRIGGQIEYRVGGSPVDPADVLHIKYASWPGDTRGHGPLESAGARLLQVAALTKYATGLAASGGLPPAILKYPRRVNRRQIDEIRSDWLQARMSGMGLPAVLADGVELQEIGAQLADTALAELAKFSEARIANLLGVPPFLLGLPSADAGTYVNSTNVFDFHWRAYLRPEAHAVAAALSGWLLPRGWSIELNRDEYIRPSLMERAQAYSILVASGVLSADEVRVMERFGGRIGALTSGATAEADPVPNPPNGPQTPAQAATDPVQPPGRPVITNV